MDEAQPRTLYLTSGLAHLPPDDASLRDKRSSHCQYFVNFNFCNVYNFYCLCLTGCFRLQT